MINEKNPSLPSLIYLHTGFMNTQLRESDEQFSHFRLTFQLVERRIEPGWVWDHTYPATVIYNETLDARVGDSTVEYRWLSDHTEESDEGWQGATPFESTFRIPLREAKSFAATLIVRFAPWPDVSLTKD
jgi:hypothetical protein